MKKRAVKKPAKKAAKKAARKPDTRLYRLPPDRPAANPPVPPSLLKKAVGSPRKVEA